MSHKVLIGTCELLSIPDSGTRVIKHFEYAPEDLRKVLMVNSRHWLIDATKMDAGTALIVRLFDDIKDRSTINRVLTSVALRCV